MEAVEDMEDLRAFLADDLQIRLPHVGADEYDFRSQLVADDREEALEGFDRAFPAHPEEARDAEIDLVNQGQILVPFGILNFIDADCVDLAEYSMLQPESNDVLHGVEDLFTVDRPIVTS